MDILSLGRQAYRIARRELRGGLHGFGVFLSCLFLGVFAITAIGSFIESARSGLLADASALLGGDLEIRLTHRPLSSDHLKFLEGRGDLSSTLSLRTMTGPVVGTNRALVELKAVDKIYPLYGQLKISPDQPLDAALGNHDGTYGALVEAALLQRLDLKVGDLIRIGEAEHKIRGVLENEPDRRIRAFTLGPRLLVSRESLDATGLLMPGSLVRYAYRLRMPDRNQASMLREDLRTSFPDAGWRLRTWREAAPRVRFFLDRMNVNLTLIGLCALLVGGLGVSGAVRGYLGGKVYNIATMKCLGAPGNVIFLAYLFQVLILGAIGSGAGILSGAALPYLIKALIGNRIPIPLAPALFSEVLITAAMFGLLIALVFSLKALGISRRVPAAVLFRGYTETSHLGPGRAIWVAIILSSSALAALAVLSSDDQRLASWFIAGAVACFGVFRLLSSLIITLARKLPRLTNPRFQLGLSSIYRPGSPAASSIFSLGLGLTALVIIALVQANLNDMVKETVPQKAPAYFFLDIQPDQVEGFEKSVLQHKGLEKLERFPTLRGRITAIDNIPVEQARIDPKVQWAVRGDRFLSYTSSPPANGQIVRGQWWPEDYTGKPKISLTADLAAGFGIDIGDSLTVNVLGREITAEIANLRQVDWSTLELNFAILFAPGLLEKVPQTHLAAAYLPADAEADLFKVVTTEFPNVSAISTREVLANVSRTLARIGTAFKGMASVALLTGFLVLAGAVSADQHRRIRDAVIFKVCGATRRDILTAFTFEFLVIGLFSGLISSAVGSLAAFGILHKLMETPFAPHMDVVAMTLAMGLGLTLVLGLLGTWKALGQRPSAYLRED